MKKFTAIIQKVEGKEASYVEIPFDVEAVFGAKRVKVKATFDHVPYRGSIVRMGSSCYMLGITKQIRTELGKTYGDEVHVVVEKDEEERLVVVPQDVSERFHKAHVAAFWDSLSYSTQRRAILHIEDAKTIATREKRIALLLEKLHNKDKNL
ncbi:MAG: YdeI/OmpD-associated family protein [Erysipelotrichaceae bacterium]